MPKQTPMLEATPMQYQELVQLRGVELMKLYGAHGIGVARKRIGNSSIDQLAIVFDVERKGQPKSGIEPIPAYLVYTPSGSQAPVRFLTDVRETGVAELF